MSAGEEEPLFSYSTCATDALIKKELYLISFRLYFFSFLLHHSTKAGPREFGFPETLWVLQFLSLHMKLVLWYKYVSGLIPK